MASFTAEFLITEGRGAIMLIFIGREAWRRESNRGASMGRRQTGASRGIAAIGIALAIGVASGSLCANSGAAVAAAGPDGAAVAVDDASVHADIEAFRRDPYAAHRSGATQRLLQFARDDSRVAIVIEAQWFPFLAHEPAMGNVEILLGAFVAGNLAPQLQARVKENHPIDGLEAMCAAYRQLRAGAQIGEIPELEAWSKLSRNELVFMMMNDDVTVVTPQEATTGKVEAYTHERTGFVFPPELAGASLRKVVRYKDERLGETVSYMPREPGGLDVTLYDLGAPNVPEGPSSEIVLGAFSQALRDIKSMQDHGLYANSLCSEKSSSREEFDTTVPGFNVAECLLEVAETHQNLVSWILATGSRNHIVKIRYSTPASGERSARQNLREFLNEFFEINAKPGAP